MKPPRDAHEDPKATKKASRCPRVARSGRPTGGRTPQGSTCEKTTNPETTCESRSQEKAPAVKRPRGPLDPGWRPPKLTLAHVVKAHRKAGGMLTTRNVDAIAELFRRRQGKR